MSGPLPPLLPEPGLDGGRAAGASIRSSDAVVRLVGRIVASTGADLLIQTAQGRAVLQGAPPLREGATLILESARNDPAPERTGRLVSVDRQRLEPPVPIRLRPVPAPPPQAKPPRPAAGVDVELRPIGPEGRPQGPRLTARLVPVPERAAFESGRQWPGSSAAPTPVERGSVPASGNAPARTPLPLGGASVPATPRANPTAPASSAPATPRASPAAPASSAPTTPSTASNPAASAHGRVPEPAKARALRHTIEVAVVRRDERGRVLLHGAGVTFVVETRLELPVGARLQLAIATSPAGAQPPFGSGPLEAVREL